MSLGLIQYENTSCYIDSVLYPLLVMNTDFIKSYLLYRDLDVIVYRAENKYYALSEGKYKPVKDALKLVQSDLLQIYQQIHGGKHAKCTDLRGHIDQYVKLRNQYMPEVKVKLSIINWLSGQADTKDVYRFFEDAFDFPPAIKTSRTGFTNNPRNAIRLYPSTTTTQNLSIIFDNITPLSETPKSLEEYLFQQILDPLRPGHFRIENHNVYQYYYESRDIINAPLLIVPVTRLIRLEGPGNINIKFNNPILPSLTIKTSSGTTLSLATIIIHSGDDNAGHYTSYIKYGGKWHYYDDFTKSSSLTENILGDGSDAHLLDATKSHYNLICRYSTDFYYV